MEILVLGAGMVSGPLFEYLNKHGVTFTVVSCLERELQVVRSRYPNVTCHHLDVSDPALPPLVAQHRLVINILPPPLLVQVAEMCVDKGKDMLSASYIPPELSQLHQKAVDAGVLLLNECGLDPGLDHMLAMEVIDKVTASKGKVTSFTSWCGGLPAPECRDNPLQYKFSWNPKGALMASHREAGFIKDGQTVSVPAEKLMDSVCAVDSPSDLPGVQLEGYPNTMHPHHLTAYGLDGIPAFFRGTLRYKGFCDAVKGLIETGLFSQNGIPLLQNRNLPLSWKDLMTALVADKEDSVEGKLLEKMQHNTSRLEALRGLGLLSEASVDDQATNPFDCLASHLLKTLAFKPGERDMIVLQHDITHATPGRGEERTRVGLVVYGEQGGHSAMAKTVGYPLGIVACMMLRGEVKEKGVALPVAADVYRPVLAALRDYGIVASQYTASVC